ncbi:MAG TPA: ester cyclase [Flavisolibacter sp.]
MPDVLEQSAVSIAQQNMLDYFKTHDVKYVAEDAVFHNLSTGEVHTGRAEVAAMLHYIYHVAFDVKIEIRNHIITADKAMVEGYFKGRHIGEIAGIPASNKEVDVPICVTYDLKDGLIKEARIYMLTEILAKQLGAAPKAPKTTYLVRDIFQLKFGHFRDAKKLLDEALKTKLLPEGSNTRVLTDFTGDSYRLIFEEGYDTLGNFEDSLTNSMRADEWQLWYEKFKLHVEKSYREILKQVM